MIRVRLVTGGEQDGTPTDVVTVPKPGEVLWSQEPIPGDRGPSRGPWTVREVEHVLTTPVVPSPDPHIIRVYLSPSEPARAEAMLRWLPPRLREILGGKPDAPPADPSNVALR